MGVGVTNKKSIIVSDGLTVYYDVGNPRSWEEGQPNTARRSLNSLSTSISNNIDFFTSEPADNSTGNLIYTQKWYRVASLVSPTFGFTPEDFTPAWNGQQHSTRFLNLPNYVSLSSQNRYTDYDSTTKSLCANWLVRFDSYPNITPSGFNYPIYMIAGRNDAIVGGSNNPFVLRLGKNGGQTTLEYESRFDVPVGTLELQLPFADFGGQHGNSTTPNTREMVIDITDSFDINEWVMITLNSKAIDTSFVGQSSNFWDFYINGVLVGEAPSEFSPSRITNVSTQKYHFHNSFNNVDFAAGFSYNRALTSAEILQNYNFFKNRYKYNG